MTSDDESFLGHPTSIGTDEREEIAEDIWRHSEHFLHEKMKFQTSSFTVFKVSFLFFIIALLIGAFMLGRKSVACTTSAGLKGTTTAPVITTTPGTTTAPVTTTTPETTTTPKQDLAFENKNFMTDANYTYMIVSYYEYKKSQEVNSYQSCDVTRSTFEVIDIFVLESAEVHKTDLANFMNNTSSEIFKCDSSGTCTRKCCTSCWKEVHETRRVGTRCTFTNCKFEKEKKAVRVSTSLICKLDQS
ncbi:Hypothetical predicted protein [Cloeon dipterum]|uniref:Uncharacterized protein n=1 Tax=Cloeon dipterum TaxID=197152 RepID=A0A8S1C8Z6_9INSE|nr:Hypothetical predicted protein [Cloeon dipterum]